LYSFLAVGDWGGASLDTQAYDNVYAVSAEMAKIALDNAKIEIILVLNKVDLVEPKSRLIELTRQLVSLINGVKLGPEGAHLAQLDTTTFMISALHNDGVIDLKNYLISLAPRKPWIIPKEFGKTDLSPEERVEQILLQVMLEHTHEEIPYIAEYTCLKISNLTPTRIKIKTEILVDASNQQRIVIGGKGRTLVKLRQSAVDILEDIFGKEVILMINVRSRDNKRTAGGENVNEEARREMKNEDKDV
jgi:GTP-binding protein Era